MNYDKYSGGTPLLPTGLSRIDTRQEFPTRWDAYMGDFLHLSSRHRENRLDLYNALALTALGFLVGMQVGLIISTIVSSF